MNDKRKMFIYGGIIGAYWCHIAEIWQSWKHGYMCSMFYEGYCWSIGSTQSSSCSIFKT